jgi:hypothetical protein
METLDLHGIKHQDVDRLVENFIIVEELPLRIITGNSPIMKSMVVEILNRHEFNWEPETHWNLGSLIVF